MKKRAVIDITYCVACGTCEWVCPRLAIQMIHGSYGEINPDRCVGCGLCSKECPASTIHMQEVSA